MASKLTKQAENLRRQTELQELKKKEELISQQLKEEKKYRQRLNIELSSKIQKISQLEVLLYKSKEEHESHMSMLEDEKCKEEWISKKHITEANLRKEEYEQYLVSSDIVEQENDSLRKRVYDLKQELQEERKNAHLQMERLKQDTFNTRMKVENVYQQTMRQLDVEYKKRAFEEMSMESENALKKKTELQNLLAERSVEVLAITIQQKEKGEQLRKVRIDRDILDATTNLQEKQIKQMQSKETMKERELNQVQFEVECLHKENKYRLQKEQRKRMALKEVTLLQRQIKEKKMEAFKIKSHLLEKARRIRCALNVLKEAQHTNLKRAAKVSKLQPIHSIPPPMKGIGFYFKEKKKMAHEEGEEDEEEGKNKSNNNIDDKDVDYRYIWNDQYTDEKHQQIIDNVTEQCNNIEREASKKLQML